MKSSINKVKIINDPIYGFITIPNKLIFDLIEHPYFQRLRRITQMGMSNLVYPGAHHTRFHHAVGCMHLMQKAIRVLINKGVEISDDEKNAVCMAILLHDIGHGPYSHALEHSIVEGVSHEAISLLFMKELNKEFKGKLSLAIEIFEGKYPRKFLNQLVSSQLDIDRMDYLKRDSFYTGVAEGNISSERLIDMLNVVEDKLVVEEKGIYSVEKFIVGRRLMYWQVYLHKTSVVAEKMLVNLLARAKHLAQRGVQLPSSKALHYFLYREVDENFDLETLKTFSRLDDYDILSAIKDWISHDDKILSKLSEMIINRKLLKVKINSEPFKEKDIEEIKRQMLKKGWTEEAFTYFLIQDTVENQAYNDKSNKIYLYYKNGDIIDIVKASDQLNIQALTKPVVKHFLCYPKHVKIS
ncbi:HD domain-containing protein [Wenyingzhuangia sp. 2_MG-2023]|uniref:HD domain-containing protein n=1 Tax=Wenyingzhuangia sp. 2_MG-2023 TaxID=3062639 RepID=UPI0026E31B94|nr:HD domain-containing protein [Wenyingzhuangia sp. 2_MG-2023]MDO6737535.1 HD domain-containing protein [Wenyingzhuangia sp. 2_MG-2023]MDO6802838.1 HD domain-containing protein [Wenyingzhuangia sp. 1_MG-2023]